MRGGAQREHRLQPALELRRGEAGARTWTSRVRVCLLCVLACSRYELTEAAERLHSEVLGRGVKEQQEEEEQEVEIHLRA